MGKHTTAGIDVSKATLDASVRRDGSGVQVARFQNDAGGHKKLAKWLTKHGQTAHVVLEATGAYGLDLAMVLHATQGIAVMVANPRAVRNFATAMMQRAKTDLTAAAALREFAERMPFVPWQPPAAHVLELRGISRRIVALTGERTRECNRLHALRASSEGSRAVTHDLEVNIRHLERRIELLTEQAVQLIACHADLQHAFDRMTSVRGIGPNSAVQLLAELLVLSPDMTVRQWVAHAGLDARPFQSGTSVNKPARISRVGNARIRRALFMPALVAVRFEPHVKAFFDTLVARGKKPLQAYVAVMRKLLHAIYGMLKTNSDFVGEKFYATAG